MLPRLQAEESFMVVERLAIGTGASATPREILRRWREAAGSGRQPAAVKATPRALGLLGIGVRRVPKGSVS